MIFRTLGVLDLVAVILLLGAAFFPHALLLYAGIYLVIKGFVFIAASKDIASLGDLVCGLYILLFVAGLGVPLLNAAALIYLGQKTFFTFVKVGFEFYSLYRFLRESRAESGPQIYYLR